jgi:hypothetical protein|tara:strand:+ start:70 stop:2376 length:2307 start_codon:yes stop_codon:yes gene_type:complete
MDIKQMQLADEFPELFINRARLIPIDAIGLPARALNIVASSNAKNSYDAVSMVLGGFSGISGIGAKTISESQAAVYKFIGHVESATEVEIKILIDPREEFLVPANGNFVDAFPAIIDLYLSQKKPQNAKRDSDVLNKRFGLGRSKKYTLEDLGTYYDVTRERIRQIEAKCIKDISHLLKDELNQKGWKICSKLQSGYLSISAKMHEFEWLILRDDVDQIFQSRYGDVLRPEYLDLFMEIAGYLKLPRNITGFRGELCESWCISSNYKKSEIESIFQALDVIYDTPNSIPLFDLIISAKKKHKSKKTISNESIKIALSATNDIDFDGEKITVKFSRLRSAADKAIRILESHGKPIHFSKITQEINILGKHSSPSSQVRETNLKNQLVADKRFTPIGRSGEWGLTVWGNLNNITIIQAIENVLHDSGNPLSLIDIKNGVEKLRPDASPKSLTVYLNDQPLFTRVGKNEFALTAWRMKAAPKNTKKNPVSKEDFNKILREVLVKQNPIDFPKLILDVEAISGLAASGVRQKILSTTGLNIYKTAGNRFKTVECSDLDILSTKADKKVLLRDKVQLEIRAILFENPNTPYKKGELYKEVGKNIQCLRPTFYQYLDKMDDIEKFKEGNDYFVVYRHEESVEKIEIDIDKYTADGRTHELLRRPLALLTVDDVDIALFELGLIFENTLKQYLLQKKDEGGIIVSSKDTSKLVNMVNCVVREGIVTKGHHLSTLREERNNRAHGETPTIQERLELFNKAHYISELFVKYICFFRE